MHFDNLPQYININLIYCGRLCSVDNHPPQKSPVDFLVSGILPATFGFLP